MHTDTLDQAADRLLRGYRTIRSVSPPDAPWPGTLARLPDETSGVLVDAELLGTRWRGWDAAASGHLLAPMDVVRRTDGHDALLPVCGERVEAFLRRRTHAEALLTGGEAVTLAVSIVRGVAELLRGDTGSSSGEWWLTDAGRPVLVTDVGGDAVEASASVLAAVRAMLPARARSGAAIDDVLDALGEPRLLVRDAERLEGALFDADEPAPLAVTALTSRRALTLSAAVAHTAEPPEPPRRARWADLVATYVDGDIADATSQAVTRVWRRLRRPAARRPRPLLWAGCLAAAVVAIGMLWPTGGGAPAAAGSGAAAPVASPSPYPAPSPDPVDPAAPSANGSPAPSATPAGGGWTEAAAALLALRTACGPDVACLADVMEDASRPFPPGAIDLAGTERTITLLDEFGDAAVVRVDAVGGASRGAASQLLVLVRSDGGHLLREVHDVAEQAG
ncbi:hypothetical protein [Microbacterium sp. CJ88]|uniref:hypothetical protein n=1 Tax=Microbacterium sp. CJ88 TaxID=3445672 RepID=UPI003F65F28B